MAVPSWQRALLPDVLAAMCGALAAASDGRCTEPAWWSVCARSFADLAADAEPAVRTAAFSAAPRALTWHCLLEDCAGFECLAEVCVRALQEGDLAALCAGHRLVRAMLGAATGSPGPYWPLWARLLPRAAGAALEDGADGVGGPRLALLLELMCAFTRALVGELQSLVDQVCGTPPDEAPYESEAQDDVAWLPSDADAIWEKATPVAIEQQREERAWQAMAKRFAPSPRTADSTGDAAEPPVHCCEASRDRRGNLGNRQALRRCVSDFCNSYVNGGSGVTSEGRSPPCPASPRAAPQEEARRQQPVPPPPEEEEEEEKEEEDKRSGRLAGWARSVGGALASLEDHLEGLARDERGELPEAGTARPAAPACEPPLSRLMSRISRVTHSFQGDEAPAPDAVGAPPEGSPGRPAEAGAREGCENVSALPPPPAPTAAAATRAVAADQAAALLAWLVGGLLPFVLGLSRLVDWQRPASEAPLAILSHWLRLLSAVLGWEFRRRVVVPQLRALLAEEAERKLSCSGAAPIPTAPSDGCAEAAAAPNELGDVAAPCTSFLLVCCHVLAPAAPAEAVRALGVGTLRAFSGEACGWSLSSEASASLLRAVWRSLAAASPAVAAAAMSALWPCVHHEDPRMRLAAAVALSALAQGPEAPAAVASRHVLPALLTLGSDEDSAVQRRAVAGLGELWPRGLEGELGRQIESHLEQLIERGDPDVLAEVVRAFTRLASEGTAGPATVETLEDFVLPHLGCLAFSRALTDRHALQGAVAEALLAVAHRRPPIAPGPAEGLLLPALREQAKVAPEHAEQLREAASRLRLALPTQPVA
ncbi:unnamed protein product [Prorocentrum cordatum]|uniref:HEAT repeat-containing protein 1 n=1 Tax=Prorocentrum cordatum TaxID=2364126 RepID=A0ABN9U9F6_9DINO|nr:unnamed protein product [Polarella glacialis]